MGKLLLALSLGAALLFAYWNRDWLRYERLSSRGVATKGWVIGKREAARRIDYAFKTPRKIFTASGVAGHGNPSFERIEQGDWLLVFYLPENPDVSCLGDPADRLHARDAALLWVLLPGVAAAGWLLSRELR
ncbi:MAG: hypothetical protein KGO96_14205 [Elusimicrobia bacterium]|nr:hypothetical protein [Elusimicrobiota bacterium]MDE2238012.1 hypothetical protein [Elusimicrobiota bacterium]MDE2427047.1 hypothetical protein [Elusimicrobiota bacterium]